MTKHLKALLITIIVLGIFLLIALLSNAQHRVLCLQLLNPVLPQYRFDYGDVEFAVGVGILVASTFAQQCVRYATAHALCAVVCAFGGCAQCFIVFNFQSVYFTHHQLMV